MKRKELSNDWKEEKVFFDWYIQNSRVLKHDFLEEYKDVYAEYCQTKFKQEAGE